jgi:LysM repeat protein
MADTTQYTVQPGDTLGRVSSKFFASPNSYQLIVDANPGLSSNAPSDPLTPGTVLTIPRTTVTYVTKPNI